jgi:hypothetical protein
MTFYFSHHGGFSSGWDSDIDVRLFVFTTPVPLWRAAAFGRWFGG